MRIFSIGIKDGFYRITSRICFKKPAKGQEGHRYDQDMYNEQSVRMELNRDNIKYDKTGLMIQFFLCISTLQPLPKSMQM